MMKTPKTPILQRLPLGLSTFSKIRSEGCLYVDKTEHAYGLITQGYRYFLSRPRRFGKSLLVSTLQEILEANKPLFKDLWIENSDYRWNKHGVITLDFSRIEASSINDLRIRLCELLQQVANSYQLELMLNTERPASALEVLVIALHRKFGHVAILIDEYDSPILKNLNKLEQAEEIIDSLRSFFAVIKGLDKEINFVFITGVSSFAKAGLFSGMNNLKTITLDKRWATICGYTDQEIDHYFSQHIQAWTDEKNISYDELRLQIKDWYNGYRFGAHVDSVYNPFSIMSALDMQEFENFWLATGTPSFLIKEFEKIHRISEMRLLELESIKVTSDALGIFAVGKTPLSALMFQTGYLTITGFDADNRNYQLGYPNYEVRTAVQKYLLGIYTNLDFEAVDQFALKVRSALVQKNISELVILIKSMFARVSYHEHMQEEAFYHGLLQVLFGTAGLKASSEISMSNGRMDMVIELSNVIYLLELKLNQSAEKALEQIEKRQYYQALKYHNKPIILIGLNFHRVPGEFDITYATKEMGPA